MPLSSFTQKRAAPILRTAILLGAGLLAACSSAPTPGVPPSSTVELLLTAAPAANEAAPPAGIVVGAPAPDFTLPAANGDPVTLSGLRGQPVLLFFHMAGG